MPLPDPTIPPGLTSDQAAHRLAEDGPNELPRPPRRTTWRIAGEVAREPMFQLLAAAVAIYWLLGDLGEAGVLLAFLGVIVAITLVQERRTERVLEALHDLTSPRALVWRDGERRRVAGTEVVVGDLVALAEGDRVPADGELAEANDLAIDESLLTGESLPVPKAAGEAARAGTLVTAGQGLLRVTATGARSEIGRIGLVLGTLEAVPTPLAAQTRQLVRWFSVLGLAVSVGAGALYALTQQDWLGGALAGITLAMSMLPQEFLLILTVFMAMGAWRLSQHRVLTRRPAAIEALGAATVLCADKTGTLTHNRMRVAALVGFDGTSPQRWTPAGGALPAALAPLLAQAVRASERDPLDPMERAIHALGRERQGGELGAGRIVREYGLDPALPVMTHVWDLDDGGPLQVALKGAPECVADLCRLDAAARDALLAEAAALADQGMRVLAVASASHARGGAAWPADARGFELRLMGLLALADPLRENVPAAVQECRRAGIRVVMITGDHAGTARAIARQAGIDGRDGVLVGDEIAALDDAALRAAVRGTNVFARVPPRQKLRIVEALKAGGDVVAMTGDGVNDAPSLKAAHIGVAMGGRGTDVARESAALVLLDDDFGSLVAAIRLGRRIFDNLRKGMRFVFAVHVPIAGLTLLPLLLGWPLLFTPMHIAFLEIVIDPVCSIAFEAEEGEADLMARPPRDPSAALFSPAMIVASLLQGVTVLLLVGGFYAALLHAGTAEAVARAASFVALVVANLGLILANRGEAGTWRRAFARGNRALAGMAAATLALLAATVAIPPLRELFGFAVPSPALLAGAVALGAAALPLLLAQRAVSRSVQRAWRFAR